MQSTQSPTLVPLAFAANGTKNTIPEASQIGITNGAASLNDGFPPLTMTPIAAGGTPPSGADMNGILNLLSQSIRWQHAGGHYAWNSAFAADTNVGGYPAGAMLLRADLTGFWLNASDNNATNPDATDGSAANWVPGYNYGVTAIAGLTNANVTLTPAQAAKNKITLAGTLTSNIQIIFPAWTKEWTVVNNTTGNFAVTAKTAAGTGVTLSSGQSKITGDGTNITQPAESVATATQGQQAAQLAQVGFRNQAIYKRIGGVQQVSINGGAFTTTGATSFPAPLSGMARVRLWAGGGGGGASSGGTGALGGGGGGGGYNEFIASGLASATAITVGAGGTAGAAGPTQGGQGCTSSFGAIGSAFGGTGGQAQTGVAAANGGVGGNGSGGTLIISGQAGGSGFGPIGSAYQLAAGGGAFGTSVTSGPVSAIAAAGFAGTFPGGGASGTQSSSGVPGADGLVIVDY